MTWTIKVPDRALILGQERSDERKKKREQTVIDDELLLAKLGYKQSLSRQLSTFSNFAISFGCCSVLSGLLPVRNLIAFLLFFGSCSFANKLV